jgi:hypothetical protein
MVMVIVRPGFTTTGGKFGNSRVCILFLSVGLRNWERMEEFIFDLHRIVSFRKRPDHCTHENSDEKRCLKLCGRWLAYNLPNTLQDHK